MKEKKKREKEGITRIGTTLEETGEGKREWTIKRKIGPIISLSVSLSHAHTRTQTDRKTRMHTYSLVHLAKAKSRDHVTCRNFNFKLSNSRASHPLSRDSLDTVHKHKGLWLGYALPWKVLPTRTPHGFQVARANGE